MLHPALGNWPVSQHFCSVCVKSSDLNSESPRWEKQDKPHIIPIILLYCNPFLRASSLLPAPSTERLSSSLCLCKQRVLAGAPPPPQHSGGVQNRGMSPVKAKGKGNATPQASSTVHCRAKGLGLGSGLDPTSVLALRPLAGWRSSFPEAQLRPEL